MKRTFGFDVLRCPRCARKTMGAAMTTDKPAGTIASRRRNRFGLLRPVGGEHSHSGHSPQVKTRHVHSMPRQQRLRGGPLLFIVLLAAGVPIANQIAQSSPQGAIVFMSCLSIA